MDTPGPAHQSILSSITSTELQKIVFPVRYTYYHDQEFFAKEMKSWGLIDEELCGLVDRLRTAGYRHTLEAELRFAEDRGDLREYDFTEVLPKFREKGVVTVVNAVPGQVIRSSIHSY